MTLKRFTLGFGLLLSIVAFGQDIDNNDISFSYIKLPETPLKISARNYQSAVVQKFIDLISQKTEQYNQQLKQANDEYQKATEAQALLQKLEDEKYANAMNAWNKKSKAEQMQNPNLFPQRTVIPAPSMRQVPKPDLPKTYDEKQLAEKYVKLDGFTNSNFNPVIITVTLHGFDTDNPVIQERVVQRAVPASGTVAAKPEIKKYSYSIKYRHPMSYKLEIIENNTVIDKTLPELDIKKEYRTNEYDSLSILERNWLSTKANVLDQLQDQAINDNLSYIRASLNDKYGYPRVQYKTLLSVVDEKKDYQDYKEAYVAAENAYKTISTSDNKSAAYPELDKAIGLWENALKESDPNNRKARVDGDVTEITHLNLIEAYIWKDDYAMAKAHIDKLKTLDPSRKGRRRMEGYEQLYVNNKARFEANK